MWQLPSALPPGRRAVSEIRGAETRPTPGLACGSAKESPATPVRVTGPVLQVPSRRPDPIRLGRRWKAWQRLGEGRWCVLNLEGWLTRPKARLDPVSAARLPRHSLS
jgi:hypothetical protein